MRSCTSGSSWTWEDLNFFNIVISRERSFEAFFGQVPPTDLSSEILELAHLHLDSVLVIDAGAIRSRDVRLVVKDIIAVTKTHRFEESAVEDMSRSLLHLLDYDAGNLAIRTRTSLDLEMSNGKAEATPALCVETLDTAVKLLIQEDKSYYDAGNGRHLEGHEPEAQLCAEAIAAYQENVKLFERLGRDEFPAEQIIPGIVMLGTCPTFYVIRITKALSECVKRGAVPELASNVMKYVVPNLPINISDTFLSLEHRQHIIQCLEAFKRKYLAFGI